MKRFSYLLIFCSFACLCHCGNSTAKPDYEFVPKPDTTQTDGLYEWTESKIVCSVEAEQGSFSVVNVATSQSGYSGSGYLDGFWQKNAQLTLSVDVPRYALYSLRIRYLSEGTNSLSLVVNGEKCGVDFPKSVGFQTVDMGSYPLSKGRNTIQLTANWGNVLIDKMSIFTAPKHTFTIAPKPVDDKATAATVALYDFLCANFTKHIIAGDLSSRITVTDRSPMLLGFDLYSYTQGYPWHWDKAAQTHVLGAEDNGNIARAINWYQQSNGQGIVTFHWHWCPPSQSLPGRNTFYTENTSFDIRKGVEEGTEEHELLLADIDAVAEQLKRLSEQGVPIIFRPLHEAGGGWFWWGAKGAEPCLKLYDMLYERLTLYHNLHNMLWAWSTSEKEWYPGNDKVDIVGFDSYPGDFNYAPQQYVFNKLYQLSEGSKLIAMTENGPLPDPTKSIEFDTPWAYFMTWGDLLYKQNSTEHIVEVYNNPLVLTLQ